MERNLLSNSGKDNMPEDDPGDIEFIYCGKFSLLELVLIAICGVFIKIIYINGGFPDVPILGAIDVGLGHIVAFVVTIIAAYVTYSRWSNTVVVTKDKDIGSLLSDSLNVSVSNGNGVNKSGEIRAGMIPRSTNKVFNWSSILLSSFILLISFSVVALGRVQLKNERYAPLSLYNEWSYDLEQVKPMRRIINSIYLIPDAFYMVYEFGIIGKIVGVKKNKCPCGRNKCNCQ